MSIGGHAPANPLRSIVRAAGGLILREGPRGAEIALVHRPGRADWSFPKGKVELGETDEACALREVFEETGLTCAFDHFAGTTRYVDNRGREKVVRYWTMHALGGAFQPSEEVDDLSWQGLESAASMLSYQRDRELLDSLRAGRFDRST